MSSSTLIACVLHGARCLSFMVTGLTGANAMAQTVDTGSGGDNIGDIDVTARYQLTNAHGGWPFLIGNLQATAPTGTDPFKVARSPASGVQLEAPTGSGFWSVYPSLTAILPSDPAVLFGSVGYIKAFGHGTNTLVREQGA